ncbi:hypothetical protein LSTR_LSTR006354 [Laodelphax striatellus]|uniref:Calponin-homology (CH) domain-containing protein n=1 Tax=Laodelphax striatellus TaxID=195883 RepID=A0A482XDL3_LAOST|nr:hypothetical protein LSTR_LSTR006354 [Laodelphax striatellus]
MSFSKRRGAAFEVHVTPKKLRSNDSTSSESVVVLAPFQPLPKLTLENVRVGSTGTLQLSLVNPHKKPMDIELVDVPSEAVGFTFSQTRMTIPSDSSSLLVIQWSPTHSFKPTRYVLGLRPVGRTRNLSEIILTVSTLQSQGVHSRVREQDKLAKMERVLKNSRTNRSRPLTENEERECENKQWQPEDRRATFTKKKSKLQWTDRSQGRNSPLSLLNPVVDPIRSAVLNKTFEVSPGVNADRRRSSDRFSTDSLESGTERVSLQRTVTTTLQPCGEGSDDRSHCRRSRRSNERLDLDLFNLGLPADLVKSTQPKATRERSAESAERIGVVTTKQDDESKNENRSHRRRLTRSNERPDLDLFNLALPADLVRKLQPNPKHERFSKSPERDGAVDDTHIVSFSNEDRSHRRTLRRSNEELDLDTFNLDSPTDFVRNAQFNKVRERCTKSLERVGFDTAEHPHDLNCDDRSHRRRCTRSNERLDLDLFNLASPADLMRDAQPVGIRERRTKSVEKDGILFDIAGQSDESKTEERSHRTRRTRSNERLDLDLFNLALPADLVRDTQPVGIRERRTKSVEKDGISFDIAEQTDESKTEDRSHRRRLTRSSEQLDLDLFNLGLPADLLRKSKPSDRVGVVDDLVTTAEHLDESKNEQGSYRRKVTKSNLRRNINLPVDVQPDLNLPPSSQRLDMLDADCESLLAPSPSKRSRPESILDDSFEQKVLKMDQLTFDDTDLELQSAESSKNQNRQDTLTDVPELVVTSPERSEVCQPDRTEGAGFWLVSPPKRLKVKPPSDSPVVLPPPSRVARRSTMTQRLMNRSGSTVAMGATAPRKSELQARAGSSSRLDAGSRSASVSRKKQPQPLPSSHKAQAKTKQSGSVSRLVPRRLLLTSSSSQDSISSIGSMTSLATPSAFLCPPSATFLGHTIDLSKNPFREDTIQYLENSWIDDKEKELLKWVNKILSPPLEFQTTCLMPSKQEMQCVRPHVDTQQPQTTVHRLFSVRRAATALLLSYDIAHVLHKVHTAIEKGSIQVRADKDLHMDLGLQGIVVKLLMCYHPLWLRVALEAVYGRGIHLRSNSDVVGLIAFIRRHLLSDPHIVATNSHPTVPHYMLPPFEGKMKKFILCKFIMIVYFLDRAKTMKLIRHDPCLFCTDSDFKDSRSILLEFNKELIKGGDMTKYLSTMGLKLEYKQTYLEEFDFRVKNRNDLRDGVRLAKLVDTMLNVRLVGKLRVPAVSRTQKIHNVGVALKGYTEHTGNQLENGVTAQDIVNGHREKMLSLVWQLRNIREQQAVKVLIGFWRRNANMIKLRMGFHRQRHAAQLIQKWWRRTVMKRIEASSAVVSGDRLRQAFIRMRRAAIVIQRHWRANHVMRVYRERMLKLKKAALLVAKRRAAILKMRTDKDNYLRMKSAAILIQRTWRRRLAIQDYNLQEIAQKQRSYYQQLRAATILLQRRWRSIRVQKKNVARRKYRSHYSALKSAVMVISERRLALLNMRKQKAEFIQLKRFEECSDGNFRKKVGTHQDEEASGRIHSTQTVSDLVAEKMASNFAHEEAHILLFSFEEGSDGNFRKKVGTPQDEEAKGRIHSIKTVSDLVAARMACNFAHEGAQILLFSFEECSDGNFRKKVGTPQHEEAKGRIHSTETVGDLIAAKMESNSAHAKA